jgi:hypothetical protein
MPENPFVTDPAKAGPFDRCPICFSVEGESVTYCDNCGNLRRLFVEEKPQPGAVCVHHPKVPAKSCCVICGKPVCSNCIEHEGIHSFNMARPQCGSCLKRIAELENTFRLRLEKEKVCAKHPGKPAVARCTECHLPHCEKCLYFTTAGWLRKKIGKGPLCLVCYRRNTLGGGRENWISLPAANASGLLRGLDPAALL